MAMEPIIVNTLCPFAVKAKLWSAPPWDETCSLHQNFENSIAMLVQFTRFAQEQGLEGFVFQVPINALSPGMEGLSDLTRALVETLMASDPADPRAFRREDVLDPEWRLTFGRMSYFAAVFSPLYGPEHTRSTHGVDHSVFVMLQPGSAFIARLGHRSLSIRRSIRTRFRKASLHYSPEEIEVHKFVLPVAESDGPVRWYE